jgi:uncharacterized lipoprotein YmbA
VRGARFLVLRRGLGAGLVWLAVSCASPDPTLFTLMAEPGAVHPARGLRVELTHVGLPRYLDRPGIVLAAQSYQVTLAANARWAEPLGAMVERVLADDLRARLPGAEVFTIESPVSGGGASRVEVDLTHFESDGRGEMTLEAVVGIVRPGRDPEIVTVARRRPLPSEDVGSEVAAMSALLGDLADEIAARLTRPA